MELCIISETEQSCETTKKPPPHCDFGGKTRVSFSSRDSILFHAALLQLMHQPWLLTLSSGVKHSLTPHSGRLLELKKQLNWSYSAVLTPHAVRGRERKATEAFIQPLFSHEFFNCVWHQRGHARSVPRCMGHVSSVTSAYSGDHWLPGDCARVWGICTGQGSVHNHTGLVYHVHIN